MDAKSSPFLFLLSPLCLQHFCEGNIGSGGQTVSSNCAVCSSLALYYISLYLGWDDQQRNQNMNNKDHIVGQLTNCAGSQSVHYANGQTVQCSVWSNCALWTNCARPTLLLFFPQKLFLPTHYHSVSPVHSFYAQTCCCALARYINMRSIFFLKIFLPTHYHSVSLVHSFYAQLSQTCYCALTRKKLWRGKQELIRRKV